MEYQADNSLQRIARNSLGRRFLGQEQTPQEMADTAPSGGHPRGTEKLSFDSTLLIDAGTALGVPSAAHGHSVDVGFCNDHDPVPDSRSPFGLFRCDGLILNTYGMRRKLKFFQRMNHCGISVIGPVAVFVKATNGLVHNPSGIHSGPSVIATLGGFVCRGHPQPPHQGLQPRRTPWMALFKRVKQHMGT